MLDRLADRHALSIDWDQWSLRVVHVRLGRTTAELVRVLSAPMPPELANLDDAAGIGQFLRRVLDQEGIRTRRAMLDVPRQQSILNLLQLPDAPDEDLVGMVRFQVSKDLPFSQHEAILDFVNAGVRDHGKTAEVLVAAIRNDVLAFYQQVCETAGLRLIRAGLRPFATTVAVTRASESAASGRTLVVDIGPRMTEIDLIRDGHLVFSRAAAVTIDRADDVETAAAETPAVEAGADGDAGLPPVGVPVLPSVSSLAVEVMRSFEAYRTTDPGCQLDRIIVAGATGIEAAFVGAVSQRLGAPAAIFDPSPLLGHRGAAYQDLSGSASAIGLALSQLLDSSACFDFLHPRKQTPPQVRRLKRVPLVAAVVVLGFVAVAVGYWQWVTPKRDTIANLEREIRQLEKRRKGGDELADRLKEVRAWRDRSRIWLDEICRLVQAFPDTAKTYATKLTIDSKGEMKISVVSKLSTGPNVLAENLARVRAAESEEPRYIVETGRSIKAAKEDFPFTGDVTVTLADLVESDTSKRKLQR